MALARWQSTIVDNSGLVQSLASIEVRRESDLALVNLYTDRAGTIAAGNPVLADSEGYVYFHVAGGAYKITATKDTFSRVWRYVGIGMAAESDLTTLAAGDLTAQTLSISTVNPTTGLTPLLGGFTVPFNLINIETDNSTEPFTAGLGLRYVYGTGGDKVAMWIECGGYTPSAASENVGLLIEYHQTGGAGGASSCFGQNTYMKLETGCTGYTALCGAEIDIEAQAGTSLDYKVGWTIVLGIGDAVQGTTYDCGYALGSLTGTSFFKTGILIGNMHGHAPLGSTSTIIATTGSSTVVNGIDFTSYTFTGNAFASPNFNITGAGHIGVGTAATSTSFLTLAAGTTAKSALRFIQGAAPSAPVDGDMWREDNTNTGLKIRINGVTKTITVA